MNNLQVKELEKKKTKPKASRKGEILQIRADINEMETKKTVEKINRTNSGSIKKINKIDRTLARFTKEKRRLKVLKSQVTGKKWDITTNFTEIKSIRQRYEQLYANKSYKLEEMDKFLETCDQPKLTQKETDNQNRPTM